MSGLAETLSRLSSLRGNLQPDFANAGRLEALSFSPNPGSLGAKCFVPADLKPLAPLVVALHGCTQSAAGYDNGSGWSHLAERGGFAVLFPEQRRENNQNLCFNWFSSADTDRGLGEAASIHAMIDTMIAQHGLDPARVFITGLSAGGAMANAMLAVYPETFAAGAVIAGLPFGVAHSIPDAFQAMRGQRPMSRATLGALVRDINPQNTRWPVISVWHGTADRTVDPTNGEAVVNQWLEIRGLSDTPTRVEKVDGQTRSVWCDASGRDVVEAYSIAGMGHGTPLDSGAHADEKAGPFMLDVGISSTLHSARSWKIVSQDFLRPSVRSQEAPAARRPTLDGPTSATPPAGPRKRRGAIDVGQVINDALRSAGLLR